VNGGDDSPGLVEMSLGVIFGESLTEGSAASSDTPAPALANTSVMICGTKPESNLRGSTAPGCTTASLLFVSPEQISFIVPAIPRGAETGNGGPVWFAVQSAGQLDEDAAVGNSYQTYVAISHPALLQAGFDCYFGATDPSLVAAPCGLTVTQLSAFQTPRGMITDSAGQPVTSLNPVQPGSNYTIWLTGLNPRGTPPAAAHVFLGSEDRLLMASSLEAIHPNEPNGYQQVLFNAPAALNSMSPCAATSLEISLWVSQNVAGTRYLSKPVNLPLQVAAGGPDCIGN
jgi:uncharacterized protein (TIGR03437 family)